MTADAPALPAVLLGGSLNTISAARALGSRGIAVDVLHDGVSNGLVSYSRFCRRFVDFGPQDVQHEWLSWLLASPEPAVVIPCCDDGVELIARHRSELLSSGHRPVEADPDVLLAMLDKDRTYELARTVGVPAPRTATVHDLESLGIEARRMRYPCATKPVQPNALRQALHAADMELPVKEIVKGKDLRNAEEAISALSPVAEMGVPMLLTEVVEGPDANYCSYYSYLDHHGEPLFHFTKRKLRQYPIHFGGGTYHKTEWQPDVAEMGLAFFQGIGLRGIGNVEFKRDSRDGQLKLIECNPRLTASDNLIRAAGVDIPYIAYCAAAGYPVEAPDGFADGLWQWLPADDLKAFGAYRREGEMSVWEYAKSILHKQHFPVMDLDDVGPAVVGAYRTLRRRVQDMAQELRSEGERAEPVPTHL
ncbi:MAG: hypothetical protein M0Z87_01780 [Actinomycetota bacterium]|nr:hypothetical protein [Actinomycetota bacterium]